MDEQYKIQLGVELSTDDLQTQINNAGKNATPIKLNVEIENLNEIKKQIQGLGKNDKNTLTLNTDSLEASLRDVKSIITDIKTSIGTLDSKSGMKSLLSSINQISSALDKASNKFEELNAELKTLSSKDFSFNIGVKLGGSNSVANNTAYGDVVRNQIIPELQKQEKALAKYLAQYYNTNEFNAINTLLSKSGNDIGGVSGVISTLDRLNQPIKKGELGARMQELRDYINLVKQAAKTLGVDLTPVTSGFNKQADDMVNWANDIKNGTKEAKDSVNEFENVLKRAFGGGINSDQLDSIVSDLKEIKTALMDLSSGNPLNGLIQSFEKLSASVDELISKCGNVRTSINNAVGGANADSSSSNNSTLKETSNELKKIKDLARQIGQLDFKIKKFGDSNDINQVREFERQLELVKKQYNEVANTLNTKDIDFSSTITKEFVEARNKMAELDAKVADTKAKLAQDIKIKVDTDIAKNISKAHSDFDKLSTKTVELKQKLDLLDNIKVDLDTAAANNDIEGLITANERYEKVLKDVKAQLDINKRAEKDALDEAALQQAQDGLSVEMSHWLKKNSAAAKDFGGRIQELQAQVKNCDKQTLSQLRAQFTNIKKEAQLAGKTTQTLGDKLKTQFSKYSSYFSVASVFMYASQGMRDMFEQVKLIDSAMTELKKVTDETDASYNKFLKKAASKSKELGTTIDGLVSSTADFARLGYGFKDAQGLAEVANIYAVVGDEIEGVEGATESLISTMAAFKDEKILNGLSDTDFAMNIIDSFNELGKLIA